MARINLGILCLINVCFVSSMIQAVEFKQLEPFKGLAHGLRSGPILIIDKRSFYITNLQYDGKGPDAHFWVGNGTNGPDEHGIPVADENGSRDSIKGYSGQSIYIELPQPLTMDQIDYFGIWCIEYKHNFGYVNINKPVDVPEPSKSPSLTTDGKFIVRIPKCCPDGYTYSENSCGKKTEASFINNINFTIHDHNETHLDNSGWPGEKYIIQPYTYMSNCSQRFIAEPNEFLVLKNGSLIITSFQKQLQSLDNFCFDMNEIDSNIIHAVLPFICDDIGLQYSQVAYHLQMLAKIGSSISFTLLILTVITYSLVNGLRDALGICRLGHSTSILLCYLCIFIAFEKEDSLHRLGGFYRSFEIMGYFWYTATNFELYYMIKFYNIERTTKGLLRKIYYAVVATIPSICLGVLVTYASGDNILLPYYIFDAPPNRMETGIQVFFVMYGIVIISNILAIGFIVIKKNTIDREEHDHCWSVMRSKFNNVTMASAAILFVLIVVLIFEILCIYIHDSSSLTYISCAIHTLQGTFIFIIYILREQICTFIKRFYISLSIKKEIDDKNEEMDDIPLRIEHA